MANTPNKPFPRLQRFPFTTPDATKEKPSHLITTDQWTELFYTLVLDLLQGQWGLDPDWCLERWTLHMARTWVQHRFHDQLHESMVWSDHSDEASYYLATFLRELYQELDAPEKQRVQHYFDVQAPGESSGFIEFLERADPGIVDLLMDRNRYHLYDRVDLFIQEWVHFLTDSNRWWVWLPTYYSDQVVVESQGDYRILVFYEKWEDAEW